jgi:hypothetical protein
MPGAWVTVSYSKPERFRYLESNDGLGDGRTGFQPVPDHLPGTTRFGAARKRGTTRRLVNFRTRSRQAGRLSYGIVAAKRAALPLLPFTGQPPVAGNWGQEIGWHKRVARLFSPNFLLE